MDPEQVLLVFSGGIGALLGDPEQVLLVFSGGIGALVALWMLLAVGVKRWHDRDKTGWWMLINFVPVIGGLWYLIECGFLRGTSWANRYGPEQLYGYGYPRPMTSAPEVDRQARALCAELVHVTGRRPVQRWKVARLAKVIGLDAAAADAAVAHAVEQKWLVEVGEPPESVCLTDAVLAEGRATTRTEQSRVDRILHREPRAERGKEATKNTDPERAGAAAARTIATEGRVTRAEAARQDGGKALREWITVILLGLTIIFLGLTMAGVYWQVHEMIAVNGSIRDQAEAAKKTAEASTRLSEAADQSLMAAHRAWIAPRLAYFLAEPVIGKPVEMWIEYRNPGHEPADGVVGEFNALAVPPSEIGDGSEARSKMKAFAEKCQDSSQWSGGSVVYPTFDSVRSYLVGFKLPDDLIDNDVARGRKLIIAQYCFRYRTFDIPRHSLVCYYYRKGVSVRNNLDLCEFDQTAN